MPNEEDIRAALRVRAGQAPDAQRVLTEIRERQARQPSAAGGGRRSARMNSRTRPTKTSRRVRLLAAMAASAAVVALIATSVALTSRTHAPSPTVSSSVSLRSVPRFYMALVKINPLSQVYSAQEAVIRDTVTGATLATIRPPKGYGSFIALSGAADDRTFVLAADAGKFNIRTAQSLEKFFVVRFRPSSGTASITVLPIPQTPKTSILDGIALSPSGTELAVAVQVGKNRAEARLSVYSMTTGAVRSWLGTGTIGALDNTAMSWSRTGTLAFNWYGKLRTVHHKLQAPPVDGIWLLNTSAPGGSLLGRSRLVVQGQWFNTKGSAWAEDGVLTPDGTKIVVALGDPFGIISSSTTSGFAEYSAATGRRIRIVHVVTADGGQLLEWTNSSGSVLVVSSPTKRSGKLRFGVLSDNRFRIIPKAPPVSGATVLAF